MLQDCGGCRNGLKILSVTQAATADLLLLPMQNHLGDRTFLEDEVTTQQRAVPVGAPACCMMLSTTHQALPPSQTLQQLGECSCSTTMQTGKASLAVVCLEHPELKTRQRSLNHSSSVASIALWHTHLPYKTPKASLDRGYCPKCGRCTQVPHHWLC